MREEIKEQAKIEYEDIEKTIDQYGCSYADAKQALRIANEMGIGIKDALYEATRAWRAADFVPKPENQQNQPPIEM